MIFAAHRIDIYLARFERSNSGSDPSGALNTDVCALITSFVFE